MNILYNKALRTVLAFLFAIVLCLPTADAACYDTNGDGIIDTCDTNMGPIQRVRARAAARQTARAAATTAYTRSYNRSVRYPTTTVYSNGYGSSGNYSDGYGSSGNYGSGYGSSGNYGRSSYTSSRLPYGIELAPGEVLMSIGPAVTTTTAPEAYDAAEGQPEASSSTSDGCQCPSDVGPRLEKIEESIEKIESDISDIKLGKIGKAVLGPSFGLEIPKTISGPKLALSSNHPASEPRREIIQGPSLALDLNSKPATLASL